MIQTMTLNMKKKMWRMRKNNPKKKKTSRMRKKKKTQLLLQSKEMMRKAEAIEYFFLLNWRFDILEFQTVAHLKSIPKLTIKELLEYTDTVNRNNDADYTNIIFHKNVPLTASQTLHNSTALFPNIHKSQAFL